MSEQGHSTRYVIVGMLRSGTTATHHCLRGHPSVSAVKKEVGVEPFLTKGLSTFTFGKKGAKAEQEHGISALFDAMTSVQRTEERAARGMKFAIAAPALAEKFVDAVQAHLPEVKIIHVDRSDAVARYASLQKSQQTGTWRQVGDGTLHSQPRLWLDPEEFAEYVIESSRIRETFGRLQDTHEVLPLSYEDVILDGKLATYDRLFEFVEVEPKEATWLEDRKLSPPPQDYVKNYEELVRGWELLKMKLEQGESREALRGQYGVSELSALRRDIWFWLRRPGYAAYRIQQKIF
jgi:hypothetical protein